MSEIKKDVLLGPHTWWKVGGTADFCIWPENVTDVTSAMVEAEAQGWPLTILGGGSNVLVSDRGVRGLVIGTKQLSGVESVAVRDGRLHIVCLAGTKKAELVKLFLQHKLAPGLFLCGIPGEVGGGVVMNAGVGEDIWPREFTEIVEWIEVARMSFGRPELVRLSHKDLKWEYRHCQGWQPGVIVRVAVSWEDSPDAGLADKVRQATVNRRQRQPLELPSGGSTFRNPPGHKAGALIELAGLKGYTVGGAQVSPKHANFIVNLGRATAEDIRQIMKHVQHTVKLKFAVDLIPEIKFLGEWKD